MFSFLNHRDTSPQNEESGKNCREIRVFVSSTFSDMQSERDALVKTFNYLRTEASKRGVSVTMIDLRWGITEEESAQGKVIDICLKEINKARPFFIGIVGDKYGSVPPKKIAELVELKDYPGVASEILQGKSYTEIEMQYGVLDNPNRMDAFFYIKKTKEVDAGDQKKLDALKEIIRKQKKYPVYYYSNAAEIASQVRKDFVKLLNERFPEDGVLTFEEEEKKRQENYLESVLSFFVERKFLRDSLFPAIDEGKLILLYGPSGYGKTSAVARLIREFSERDNFQVSYYFTGAGGSNEDLTDVVSVLLGKRVGSESAERDISDAINVDARYHLIILDGLDSLNLNDIEKYGMQWISLLPDNYKVVVSADSGSGLCNYLLSLGGVTSIECPPLSMDEKKQFVVEYLIQARKKLEARHLDWIIEADITKSSSVLRVLLDELTSFGYYEKLDEKIVSLTRIGDEAEFYKTIIEKLKEEFRATGPIFQSLISTRCGLAEDEIAAICEIRPIDVSLLLGNCTSFVDRVGGRVRISNTAVRNFLERSFADNTSIDFMRRRILDFFYEQCRDYSISFSQYDSYKKNFLYDDTSRIILESAFQMYALGESEVLFQFISRPSIFEILFRSDRVLLRDSWKYLMDHGYKIESMVKGQNIEEIDMYLKPVVANDLGRFIMSDLNNPELSRSCYELCMSSFSEGFGISDSTRRKVKAANLNNLAIAAYRSGKHEFALTLFEESLAMKLNISDFGRVSGEVADAYSNLGRILKVLERFDEAISKYTEAVDILKTLHNAPHIDTADALYDLAYCYYRTDDDVNAYHTFSEAFKMYSILEGNNSRNVILSQFGMGRSLFYTSGWVDSLDVLNEVLEKSINVFGEKDETTAGIYYMLGRFWEKCYKVSKDDGSLESINKYLEQSAICYAHSGDEGDAQRMLDILNPMKEEDNNSSESDFDDLMNRFIESEKSGQCDE